MEPCCDSKRSHPMNDDNPDFKKHDDERGKSLSDYRPLISLILVAALAAFAVTYSVAGEFMQWMHYFMGIFLCVFALLKLFNPSSFADGFQMYDLIAKRSRTYALSYPYIELALGLGYLSFIFPIAVYIATIVVLGIGAIGVVKALREGLDINCPCMGSILDVPLSTVTLTEDLGMAAMALVMLFMMVV